MKQQHVMITGASRGIGLNLARLYDQRGAVVSNLSRNAGPVGQHFACDMRQNPVEGFQAAQAAHGKPDILILNAGITEPGLAVDLDIASFQDQMQVNFFAAVALAQAAINIMEAGGKIVFIGSGAAYFGIEGHSAYCASKFALRGFAESLRGELKPRGITVSLAHPPNSDTDMFKTECQQLSQQTAAITMAAKTWSPEQVAKAILRGIDKNRFEIPVGVQMRLLGWCGGLLKPLVFYQMDRLARQARQKP